MVLSDAVEHVGRGAVKCLEGHGDKLDCAAVSGGPVKDFSDENRGDEREREREIGRGRVVRWSDNIY